MQASHSVSAVFDDPNLVSVAGLVPVLALARRAGLHDLAAEHLSVPGPAGANSRVKVTALVAGMVAGADSIEDMDLLRHGGMGRLFTGVRAPTTLGTHLRAYTFGHVRQLDAVAARFLAGLATRSPLLAGVGQVAYLDIDDTIRETHGYQKQGVGYGYSKVKGLNAVIATICTPVAAPVIAAARRGGARFSVTARMDPAVTRAITTISDDAWVTIKYPNAIWDDEQQRWISDAQVAEVPFTAFTSRRKGEHVTSRLIARPRTRVEEPDRPATRSRPTPEPTHHNPINTTENAERRIQVQTSDGPSTW